MKPQLSLWSSYYNELPFEQAIDRFVKNGIFAIELSSEHGKQLFERDADLFKTAREIRELVRERGVRMTQGHLPLSFKIVIERDRIDEVLRYIDFYEALGVENLVLHCDRMYALPEASAEERFRENVISLKIIAKHIEHKQIHICLENLRPPKIFPVREPLALGHAEDLLRIIDAVGSDRFAICLDTGHLNLVENPDQTAFIRTAGKHLRAIHIADNQNNNDLDEHLMPFGRGTVDFFAVVRALREISYEGVFNYEIGGESRCPFEIRDLKLQYIRSAYDFLMSAE